MNRSKFVHIPRVNILMLCVRAQYLVYSPHVLNFSMSGHRVINSPAFSFYSATTFAITALTEGLRKELRDIKSNIKITVSETLAPMWYEFNLLFPRLFHLELWPLNLDHVSGRKTILRNLLKKCMPAVATL